MNSSDVKTQAGNFGTPIHFLSCNKAQCFPKLVAKYLMLRDLDSLCELMVDRTVRNIIRMQALLYYPNSN